MLRLAPLQTGRSTGARPLRFVQFSYADATTRFHSLLRLNILLPNQRVRKEQNHLDIWVDHTTHRIRISPDSGLQVEPLNVASAVFDDPRHSMGAEKMVALPI